METYQIDLVEIHLHRALFLNQVSPRSPVDRGVLPILQTVVDRAIQHDLIPIGSERENLEWLVASTTDFFPHALP